MENSRTRHVMNSLTILAFLIFGGLSGLILIADAPLTSATVSLPFAFLFISMMTLIATTQIKDRPKLINRYLREWLVMCVFIVVVASLVFVFA